MLLLSEQRHFMGNRTFPPHRKFYFSLFNFFPSVSEAAQNKLELVAGLIVRPWCLLGHLNTCKCSSWNGETALICPHVPHSLDIWRGSNNSKFSRCFSRTGWSVCSFVDSSWNNMKDCFNTQVWWHMFRFSQAAVWRTSSGPGRVWSVCRGLKAWVKRRL